MGRKLSFVSLFSKPTSPPHPPPSPPHPLLQRCFSSLTYSPSSWPWPSCKHPRTRSFREADREADVFKTVNSVYLESAETSCFTNTSEERSASFSTASEGSGGVAESAETVIRALPHSDRLFCESGAATSSIMDGAGATPGPGGAFEESVVMVVDSEDPYQDFRSSMEEMVAAHGVRDGERLEELLVWYLKLNVKKTHGFILGAFVDLLVGLASSSSSSPDSDSKSSSNFLCSEIEEEDPIQSKDLNV